MSGKKDDLSGSGSRDIRDRLDSWKEIATYLKRDVRTLQRWEKQEGLPVHRLQHDTQGTVFAYKAEIDAWWLNRERNPQQIGATDTDGRIGIGGRNARLLGAIPRGRPAMVAAAAGSLGLLALLGIFIISRSWTVPRTHPMLLQRQLTQTSSNDPLDYPVVSPDGRYVAYCDASGISIEHVDTGETRLIDATAGFCPQGWFSDGNRLLALGRGATWTVSLLTGNVRMLLDFDAPAAFSPDESRIAFVGTRQGIHGIWLARNDGSQLENVFTSNDSIVASSWSPNGERFAYIRSSFSSADAWIESRDLHGKNVTTVLEDARLYSSATDAGLVWLPDGRLVFALQEDSPNYRDSNLWSIKVDPHTGRTTGSPSRISNFNGFAWANLSVSRDGSRLVALKARSVLSIFVGELVPSSNRLRSVRRLTIDNWSYNIGGWTPESDGLLLDSRQLGRYQIYRQGLTARATQVLFSGAQNYLWPEYSPDKSWILFWSSEGETFNRKLQLMRLSPNGGTPTPVLTALPNSSFHCSDTRKICVLRENAAGKAVFSTFDPLHGKGGVLAETDASSIDAHGWSLSPDGKSIAYVDSPDLRSHTIRTLQLGTGKISDLRVENFVPGQVTWSQDGTVLFVTGGASHSFGWELVGVRRNGQFSVLDHNARGIWSPTLSPDGKKLAFAKDADEFNVAVLENF